RQRDDAGPEGAAGVEEGDEGGFSAAPWLAGAALVALLMTVPMMLRALTRRRRWAALTAPRGPEDGAPPRRSPAGPPDEAACATGEGADAEGRGRGASAVGVALDGRASATPRAAARRLGEPVEVDRDGARAITRIARAEELAR